MSTTSNLANAWQAHKNAELSGKSITILEQIRSRRPFYAGACVAIFLLMNASDAGEATADALLDDLLCELEAFNAECIADQRRVKP